MAAALASVAIAQATTAAAQPSAATTVAAAPPAASGTRKVYSPYEEETIAAALAELGATVDPAPAGKIVEAIVTRPLEVLEARDPVPDPLRGILNWFHATTRPYVIERELLQRRGQPWDPVRVDESERNLRGIRQLSLVLTVPLRGSAPDRVRLLVITKDIWSLRLNSDLRVAGGQLEYLLLAPSEENLLGSHQTVTARLELRPDTLTFGGGYRFPRGFGTRASADAQAAVILNRQSGEAEGSTGQLSWGMPIRSTQDEWGWVGSVAWLREVSRRFIGVEQDVFDAPSTTTEEQIPWEYETDALLGRYGVVRSFGSTWKHDVGFGVEALRVAYRAPVLDGQPASVRRDFGRAILPVSDTRLYPFVSFNDYEVRFLQITDFSTLGLQENYRLGHDVYLKLAPVFEAIGSTRDFVGLYPGAAYTVPLGDGLARGYAEATVEIEPDRVADASVGGGALVVTPRLGLGRLVLDVYGLDRVENHLNRRSDVGGEGRLRGYPSSAFVGENLVSANLELRSRPLEVWTLQLGAVAFFDAGDAWDDGEPIDVKQAVGAGLRVVLPQLDRSVLRFDWGFPLQPAPELGITGPLPGEFVLTFRQAFGVPSIGIPAASL